MTRVFRASSVIPLVFGVAIGVGALWAYQRYFDVSRRLQQPRDTRFRWGG